MDTVLAASTDAVTIVTANNRLARSVMLAFNRQQRAAGRRAWPTPDVLPWRAWISQLWSKSVANGGDAGRRTLLTDAQAAALWREIVRSAAIAPLPGSATAVAELAGRAWRTSEDWRLAPAQLLAAADSDDSRTFASLAADYERRCAAEGWADPGMLPPLLAGDLRRGHVVAPARLQLIGFDEQTPLQRELLRVMTATGCAVVEERGPPVPHGGACQYRCLDNCAELEHAARWARQKLEDDPAASVGIVVPDLAARIAEARRAVLDIFAPDWRLAPAAVLPVNFSLGESLARVGMIHVALLALSALAGQLDYRDAGQLLRTPYLGGSGAEAGARARLDLWLRQRIGMAISLAELAARAGRDAPLLSARLLALADIARGMPRRQGAAAWAGTFGEALQALGWPGDRPLGSDEFQAGIAWQEQLDDLRRCERIAGLLDLDAMLGLLGSLVRDQVFQPAGQPGAVQVLGTLEAIGQRFDALWICGLTSNAWPPAASPDPLLPLALQRELRMPDSSPRLARERAERLFSWLLASAPEVVVSCPEFAGEEPLSPSPLITRLPARSEEDLRLWTPPTRRHAMAAARGVEAVPIDPPPAVNPAQPLRGGVSLLERQARCPARAFLEFRTGAREMSTPAVGIDAATRGSITHAVLHEFFAQITSHAQLSRLTVDGQTALLDALIAAELKKVLPPRDPVIGRIAREEQARLHRLLGAFLVDERGRADFSVLSTESELVPVATPASVAALRITLRPDRMDELPGGMRLVIDYKTGQTLPALKDLRGPRPRSPQLPLYAILADAQGIAMIQLTAAGVRWVPVGPETLPIANLITPAKLCKDDGADWDSLRAEWWEGLERLAAEFLAGDFRIDRWQRREAEGQWALATRVHELPDDEEPGP